jgi:hypothetical protein
MPVYTTASRASPAASRAHEFAVGVVVFFLVMCRALPKKIEDR